MTEVKPYKQSEKPKALKDETKRHKPSKTDMQKVTTVIRKINGRLKKDQDAMHRDTCHISIKLQNQQRSSLPLKNHRHFLYKD